MSPELARPVRLDTLGSAPREVAVEADAGERAALAARFGLIDLARLVATASLVRDGDMVRADGRLRADATQGCVVTGGPIAVRIDEPFALRFVPAGDEGVGEIELDEADLDTIGYAGGAIDLGEAAAQTLALALDPFPRAPDADPALRAAGVLTEDEAEAARRETSPFAVLKALKGE